MNMFARVAAVVALSGGSAYATPDFLTFEEFPVGPSFFATAGPAQVYSVPGLASVSGGVILGNPTFLPSQSFATSPNLLGTASFGHPTLQPTITIDVAVAYQGTSVEGLLFNGNTVALSYLITAFDIGNNVLDSQVLALPANTNPNSVAVFSVDNSAFPGVFITKVTITPTSFPPSLPWDFFIDTLTFNGTIPTPGTGALLALAGLAATRRRR